MTLRVACGRLLPLYRAFSDCDPDRLAGSRLRDAPGLIAVPLQDQLPTITGNLNRSLRLTEDLAVTWQNLVFPGGEVHCLPLRDLLAGCYRKYTSHQRQELLATIATANEAPAADHVWITRRLSAASSDSSINVLRRFTRR